jgi:hypothetical protein
VKLPALLMLICFGFFIEPDLANASIYDADVIQRLHLSGSQKQEMQKVIAASRAQRNRIFKRYGINPNAKPDMSLLQRASSELMANAAHERAAARKILNKKQLRLYDALMIEIRQRIMKAL